ncbi:hypothetical protein OZX72_03845 [Bifidobacterium sp. ESL0769]|nr:hypothetical protein [Bifidobacterium sp. ESL0769]WEV68118.1 hypothetical protein OZX72_03845 [Bifidobacterium sp. ESL0769]
MFSGRDVGNALMDNVSAAVSCVLEQANKFPQIANVIEECDVDVARRWK